MKWVVWWVVSLGIATIIGTTIFAFSEIQSAKADHALCDRMAQDRGMVVLDYRTYCLLGDSQGQVRGFNY